MNIIYISIFEYLSDKSYKRYRAQIEIRNMERKNQSKSNLKQNI